MRADSPDELISESEVCPHHTDLVDEIARLRKATAENSAKLWMIIGMLTVEMGSMLI